MSESQSTLVLFDFDGTLSSKDSFLDFVQFAVGKRGYYLGLLQLSPMLATYKLGLISNHVAKERVISYFFAGWNVEDFQRVADNYSTERIDSIIRPLARKEIRRHQECGHRVVVVSASIESWLSKWCEKHDLELIATRLETHNGTLTGRFSTRNCYGAEKVSRIRERYDLTNFNAIYVYGDSRGDTEMLGIASKSFYRHFH